MGNQELFLYNSFMIELNEKEFQQLVDSTIENLPKRFKSRMDNVIVLVEDLPSTEDLEKAHSQKNTLLLGMYSGVPKTYAGATYKILPDTIKIFKTPILQISHSQNDAREQIKNTVLHELGHYFGLSEEEIANWKNEKEDN